MVPVDDGTSHDQTAMARGSEQLDDGLTLSGNTFGVEAGAEALARKGTLGLERLNDGLYTSLCEALVHALLTQAARTPVIAGEAVNGCSHQ